MKREVAIATEKYTDAERVCFCFYFLFIAPVPREIF